MKTQDIVNQADAQAKVSDIKVVGNTDTFQLLCKASSVSQGWMKSAKAMELPGGAVVQVTTQQKNEDGSYAVAEALTFVPAVRVLPDTNGGRKLGRVALRNTGDRPAMTVGRLRELLADIPDSAELQSFDPESGKMERVTGIIGPMEGDAYELSTSLG